MLVFSVPEFSFRACIFVFSVHLSSATSRAFASDSSVFSALPYLASSVLLFVSSSAWFHPVASAAVPLSQAPAPSSSASLYFAPSSLRLCWGAGGSGVDTALPRRSSVVSAAHPGFSPWFSAPASLFSVPPAVVSGSSFLPLAAPLLAPPSSSLSGFAALGWGSALAVLVGWLLPQFLGLPAFTFSLFPNLHFLPVPSPNPLVFAASASAHGLSGV